MVFRPYTISVMTRCSQNGPLDKQVFFLCAVDSASGKRFAEWNGCDSTNGSSECLECRRRMVRDFGLAHPDYAAVV